MKNQFFFLFMTILLFSNLVFSQSVGINTTAPAASAALDVVSTNKGVLVPRMTTAQMNAIASPATGLIVYNTSTNSFWYRKGSTWTDMALTSGTANGDLKGTYPNPQVDGIQGVPVSATAPTQGQVMMYDNGQWKPKSLPSNQLVFANDDMNNSTPPKTTSRSSNWLDLNNQLQALVPSTGLYLVFYSLRANNFTDNDDVYVRVQNLSTGDLYGYQDLLSWKNGSGYESSPFFFVANLTGGQILQVRARLQGTGTTEVSFEDGRITLLKLQ